MGSVVISWAAAETGAAAIAVDLSVNSGFAVADVASGAELVAFQVIEASQGAQSLNGDGDAADEVIHVLDSLTGQVHNLAVAGGRPVVDGSLVAFAVPEDDQGNTDLNGDGDTLDTVWHVYDARTGTTSNLGCSVLEWDLMVGDPVALAVVSEAGQNGADLNSDGDASDWVVHVYDAVDQTTTNLALAVEAGAANRFDAEAGIAAFSVDETDQNTTDLNGDGVADDWVLHLYDHGTQTTSNLLSASSTYSHGIAAGTVAVQVREQEEGADLNGDTDLDDKVLVVHDVLGGAPMSLGLASGGSGWVLDMNEFALAFRTRESDQGNTDLNGDGDTLDFVGHLYDLLTGDTVNLGLATGVITVIGPTATFTVVEAQQGMTDLNGDGDSSDTVLFVTRLRLFVDGFESGDTSCWTSTVP
jgi:hypothetical protein